MQTPLLAATLVETLLYVGISVVVLIVARVIQAKFNPDAEAETDAPAEEAAPAEAAAE